MALTYPVVVVPGITATHLRDEYPLPPELVWGVLERDYARVALHPDNLRYEALEPARVTADSIFEVAYEELVEELRYNLRDQEDERSRSIRSATTGASRSRPSSRDLPASSTR